MFDKLIDFIISIGKEFLPYVIVEQWNEAIMLRCGKLQQKVLTPGIHFKIPFLDSVWEATIITQSLEMNPQSITTRNGRNVVVKAIIRFRIEDVKTYLTTISQPHDVLIDTTQGMIREIIEGMTFSEIYGMDSLLTKKVGAFVRRWGIKVERVTLTDLASINSLRIIQNKNMEQQHASFALPEMMN
jgi:membrane protease subunit HflC